jgi:hypothetical protein
MQRGYKFLVTTFLAAALAVPLAGALQDHDDHDRDHDRDDHRIYDRDHKDYHTWNGDEDRAYRGWLETRHETYRDFNRLDAKRQREYWAWRHNHEDHDHH